MTEKMAFYFLICVPGIGSVTLRKLLEHFPSARDIYSAKEKELRCFLNERQAENFFACKKEFQPEKEYETMQKSGISFFTVKDREYPERLKVIPDPPAGIFCLGRLPEEKRLAVAVIGARDCSEYGRFVAVELGKELAKSGIELISGMARGIDGISQNAAILNGGRSYAVLGSGVDVCYPASNRKLYESLKERGGILSAYPPKTLAKAQNFPPRNRLVSGLADILVVVEGRINSGTLITVDMALEQGKEVYVVPGRITDRLSDGCNRLIKQGAGVFLSPELFLDEVRGLFRGKRVFEQDEAGGKKAGGKKAGDGRTNPDSGFSDKQWGEQMTEEEQEVMRQMDFNPQNTSVIFNRLNGKLSMEKLICVLMELQLKGLIAQISQGQYALCAEAVAR